MRARTALAGAAALAGLLAAAPTAAAQIGPVLVVGDSLEVGTGRYLRGELGSLEVDVDAMKGRSSAAGVAALSRDLRPQYRVVVFDLGVNDGSAARVAESLVAARGLAGDRCLVVATLHGPRPHVPAANQAIRGFARSARNVVLVDWDAAARPSLLGRDGVHPKPAGYLTRARVVADGIAACLVGDVGRAPAAKPRRRTRRRAPPGPPPPNVKPLAVPASALLGLVTNALGALAELADGTIAAVRIGEPEVVLGAPER